MIQYTEYCSNEKLGVEDFRKIQEDVKDFVAKRRLFQLVQNARLQYDTVSKSAINVSRTDRELTHLLLFNLERWDGSFSESSFEASLYAMWEVYLAETIFTEQIPEEETRLSLFSMIETSDFMEDFLSRLTEDERYLSEYCDSERYYDRLFAHKKRG